jgi:1-acyl-sn-glycerol-3-phosphate acyltransferase
MSLQMMFKDKKFSPLMWTQFFGALNDNVLKNALVVMLAFKGIQMWGLKSESLISLATLIFILPFFVFSALAGQVADKMEKSLLIRWIKLAEIVIMVVAGFGFYFHLYELVFAALFLMGLHSTFFGPVKYSVLPELVDEANLTSGNAYVEVGTFIAILIGTISGGYLVSVPGGELYIITALIAFSAVGYRMSRGVPAVRIADPGLRVQFNPIPQTISTLKVAQKTKAVFNSILGISWFWFLGAVILSLLPTVTKNILNGDEHVVTLFLAVFTIGIAVGALVCEKLSFERVEIGLVPLGSLGMTIFLVDLACTLSTWMPSTEILSISAFFETDSGVHLLLDLFMIAIFGGLFTVPLYTLIQQRSERESRSQVIGANNIMNALFMVVGSALLMLFLEMKLQIHDILYIYAALNLAIAIYIYSIVPEFTLRFLAWVLSHLLYRTRVEGSKNIPADGPAILVCNHVSFVDWLLISACVRRPLRFIMYYKFANMPVGKYLMRHAGVIPIAGKTENPEIFEKAFQKVSQYLREGELICLFPEGMITPDGELHPFKKGVEHILERDPVPVIPMALVGLWGSIFSHKDAKAFTKLPRRIWFRVGLKISQALPPKEATAANLEAQVKKLLETSS